MTNVGTNNILWSRKCYDLAFDFLNSLPDRKIPTERIHEYLDHHINDNNEDTQSIITLSYYGTHDTAHYLQTLLGLLNANLQDSKKVLLENYDIGCFCSIPASKREDRSILVLAKKL
jgi:hypothetical protein